MDDDYDDDDVMLVMDDDVMLVMDDGVMLVMDDDVMLVMLNDGKPEDVKVSIRPGCHQGGVRDGGQLGG